MIFIVLLAAHGLAHLPGFIGGWRLANLREMPYHTTVFAGHVDIGDAGMRIAGAVWLLLAVGFETAAVGGMLHRTWWGPLTAVVATVSLCLCIIQYPDARIGIVINIVILCMLAVGQYMALARGIA